MILSHDSPSNPHPVPPFDPQNRDRIDQVAAKLLALCERLEMRISDLEVRVGDLEQAMDERTPT